MNFEKDAVVVLREDLQLICLYDIPCGYIASINIDKIIKDLCGYDLKEPGQIKAYPDDIHHGYAICKVDKASAAKVSSTKNYFTIEIGKDSNGDSILWRCGAVKVESNLEMWSNSNLIV